MARKREQYPERLELGMDVIRQPQTMFESDRRGREQQKAVRGRVCYIHPRGRYHTVAFHVHGRTLLESFQGVEV